MPMKNTIAASDAQVVEHTNKRKGSIHLRGTHLFLDSITFKTGGCIVPHAENNPFGNLRPPLDCHSHSRHGLYCSLFLEMLAY